MTIEEKLKHFYDTSVDEARRQAEKDVREHKEALDAALEEHKKMSLGNAASSRKAEIANAKREINKALSAEQLYPNICKKFFFHPAKLDCQAEPLKRKTFCRCSGTDPEIHGISPL